MSSGKWRPICLGLNVLIYLKIYHWKQFVFAPYLKADMKFRTHMSSACFVTTVQIVLMASLWRMDHLHTCRPLCLANASKRLCDWISFQEVYMTNVHSREDYSSTWEAYAIRYLIFRIRWHGYVRIIKSSTYPRIRICQKVDKICMKSLQLHS